MLEKSQIVVSTLCVGPIPVVCWVNHNSCWTITKLCRWSQPFWRACWIPMFHFIPISTIKHHHYPSLSINHHYPSVTCSVTLNPNSPHCHCHGTILISRTNHIDAILHPVARGPRRWRRTRMGATGATKRIDVRWSSMNLARFWDLSY